MYPRLLNLRWSSGSQKGQAKAADESEGGNRSLIEIRSQHHARSGDLLQVPAEIQLHVDDGRVDVISGSS